MKHLKSFIMASVLVGMLASCSSTKNVAYIQNSDEVSYEDSRLLYDARIMPKDQLTITVSTINDEAAVPFIV